MNTFFKQTGHKWLNSAVQNPKKFFTYSMLFLSVSFVISMIYGIFFPSETVFKIKPPILYSKNQMMQNTMAVCEREMEKIVTELQALKIKRDRNGLQKKDILRIEYLYNQYQELKNGR